MSFVGVGIIGILTLLLGLFFFLLHIAVCVWGYNDARRKGRSPEFAILVVLGLLFFPVVGLIIYLLIRNHY
ncbi:PLDc N-terminal domain-containing protein [Paenibacillus sp. FSL W7-1279]|uniref:PLDc N-terminal domain-containing protein n=1 Tax=Paenibacillus TaxID=44249 RepID=UPI001889F6B0|nr:MULTISPECIES: PLDc N-terminal domain-containing protein [Paenibacillus]MBU5347496.1 PLDc N-terminal domain-containing protein [Paenibacillus lautus]MBX4151034.1 PLDc N-terminal domain-containing protein [Paenibacillus lautus]